MGPNLYEQFRRLLDTVCQELPGMYDLWGLEADPDALNHSQISGARFYPGRRLQGNTQISADGPSVTIRAEHHGNIEAHYRTLNPQQPDDPSYWRRLSVRECARLQTFPDDFFFTSTMSQNYRMIGNAVPPVLGWHIARALYLTLKDHSALSMGATAAGSES